MKVIFHPGPREAARVNLGGKASSLAKLRGVDGVVIPLWFALLPEACEMNEGKPALGSQAFNELRSALASLCPNGELVAVRSSAPGEDGSQYSFAGQLESFLSVHPRQVSEKIVSVWHSAFGDRVRVYREQHALTQVQRLPAVLIQRMVHAEISGVAFGADPLTGDAGIVVVSAVNGGGTLLVNGDCDADTWNVNEDGRVLQRRLTSKYPVLNDEQIRSVATLARRTGEILGCPQDIEWAFEKDLLHLLQSRPITTLAGGIEGRRMRIWDNSNIVESYSGVTTPLTFSFARRAYEGVYREFCHLLAVPPAKIAANDQTFQQLLGLIRGRVYYNLLNWYRVLALLPGFTVNRRFMEQMMGVKEGLPDDLARELEGASTMERLRDAGHLTISLTVLIANHFLLPRKIREFRKRLNAALAPPDKTLASMTPDELADSFLSLERKLLTRWDAPLLNDFWAMIFFGVLRGLSAKWLNDADGTLQNGLLCGEGGMLSAEPARRIVELAQLAKAQPALGALLCEGALPDILKEINRQSEFKAAYQAYLDEFGERCLDELKLETLTLHDDPLPLLRSVGRLVLSPQRGEGVGVRGGNMESRPFSSSRREAETSVAQALKSHPLRRWLFAWVLRHARARIRDRENLRFERTRLFGRVRRIFIQLGHRLHESGCLSDPRDVFYLEVDELPGFLNGSTTARFKELTASRKNEFDEYRRAPAPPNRFVTHGPVSGTEDFRASPVANPARFDHQQLRKGLGCCPGVVRGPVRKVSDPRRATLRHGEILVAERTDPGWVMLFPAAAGLLVERGSLLSHSAIVARELRIPTVVSVAGLVEWLHDGDWVKFDGRTGVITRLPPPAESNDTEASFSRPAPDGCSSGAPDSPQTIGCAQ